MSNDLFGQENVQSNATELNTWLFIIAQQLSKVQTLTLVKVIKCTNEGGLVPVGTVDVQPLVNQMTGNNTPVPHGIIYGVPYSRLQGGTNAVILDPQPGDIGVCGFASRDISTVKSTKAAANPGSRRKFDYSDGLYLGGVLNGTPQQYVQFNAEGVTIVSPTKITLQAPSIEIDASSTLSIASPATTIDTGNTTIDGVEFLTHTHSGVQSGTSNSGPVNP